MLDLNKIVILGGTGFIGSNLAFELSKYTKKITILTRNKEKNKKLLVLPNIEIIQTNVNDELSLRELTKGADLLINTVGVLNESDNFNSFSSLHVDLVKKISHVVSYNKIARMLHISSLNAGVSSTSNYLRTKGEAEEYLLKETSNFCNVTIFKPSVVFGEDDSFFNRFKKILTYSPVFPLACPYTKFAPIFINDLVHFMVDSINDRNKFNIAIDLTGPKTYTFYSLIKLTLSFLKIKRIIIPLPNALSKLQAYIFERLPGKMFTIDNYNSLQIDSVSDSGLKGSTSIEQVVPKYLNLMQEETNIEKLRKRSGR